MKLAIYLFVLILVSAAYFLWALNRVLLKRLREREEPRFLGCPKCGSNAFSVHMMGQGNQIATCGNCDFNGNVSDFIKHPVKQVADMLEQAGIVVPTAADALAPEWNLDADQKRQIIPTALKPRKPGDAAKHLKGIATEVPWPEESEPS